jgi:hypothetical protein
VALNKNITEIRLVGYLKSVSTNLMKSRITILVIKSSPNSGTAESCLPTNMTVTEMNVGTFTDVERGINLHYDRGTFQDCGAPGFFFF